MAELRQAFRPEFLNRLDETILFHPLTRENLGGIIDIMVGALRDRLAQRGLTLEISEAAKALIIDRGFDPLYGARPLRRYLQSSVETLIARRILSGDVEAQGRITVDVDCGELICRQARSRLRRHTGLPFLSMLRASSATVPFFFLYSFPP